MVTATINATQGPKLERRTIWISDLHLGSTGCKADILSRFLDGISCETLYLVGDIVDFRRWHKYGAYWNRRHGRVLQKLLGFGRTDTRVVYVPGNHDRNMRDWCGLDVSGIEVHRDVVHQTADGRRLLVMHGDEFDDQVRMGDLSEKLGEAIYYSLLFLDRGFCAVRRLVGRRYWSLANFLKSRSGKALEYIDRYEYFASREAARRGLDGVICGHIHHASLSIRNGMIYANDGDWVDSCTTLCERADGTLELIRVADGLSPVATLAPTPRRTIPAAA